MLKMTGKIAGCALIAMGLLLGGGEGTSAEAKGHHKKVGFFKRVIRHVKRDIKRHVVKTRRAIVKAGCAVSNKIMDGAVKAKSAITGKKPKYVWVKGHYQNKKYHQKHTKGHWRRVYHSHKHSGGAPAPAPTPSLPPQ